jgi:hypothetical protein
MNATFLSADTVFNSIQIASSFNLRQENIRNLWTTLCDWVNVVLFPAPTVFLCFHDYFQLLNRHLKGLVLLTGFHVKCSFRIIGKYLITIYICPTGIGYRSVYTTGNKLFSDFCDFQCFVVVEISFLC